MSINTVIGNVPLITRMRREKERVMTVSLGSRMLDVAIATGLFGIVVLNLLWVWPIATLRLL